MDARNLSADILNERRRQAVKLRLAGMTVAAVSDAVELSAPTVIAAHKAYLAGGWSALLLKRRGRVSGSGRKLDATVEQRLLAAMLEHLPDALGLPCRLWSDEAVAAWFEQQQITVPPRRSLARYRTGWGVQPPLNADDEATLREQLRVTPKCHPWWTGGMPWHPSTMSSGGHWLLFARGRRGQLHWMVCPHTPTAEDWIALWSRLAQPGALPLHLLVSGLSLRAGDALCRWMHEQSPRVSWSASSLPVRPVSHPDTGKPLNAAPARRSGAATSPARPVASRPSSAKPPRSLMQTTPDLIDPDTLTHLQRLEAESIHIMREVVAEAENPVMLYSIGKDSAVMLHLAMKAFYPAVPPFPLLHVDTTWKFRAMYEFRDAMAKKLGMDLLVHVNPDGLAKGINPFTHGSAIHTDIMKTEGLKQALDKYGFDVAFGGARRDEEKSRAKERIFSFRSAQHRWDPKSQRPELWSLYNTRKHKGESIRVFPISNWTELDIWQYIHLQNIPIVPLYYSAPRPVVERDGTLIMVDDERMPLRPGEVPMMKSVRFRTLGCYPLTGAVESEAATLTDIIQEMLLTKTSERQGRVIDHDSAGSMEKKKQEGYF
ncbi:MAG: sulfate adenylyltransferase subunit CysD [Methyloversatilis sp.]|nr:sulfate adenylyltransferase subunit CysD [Methyloversatilis sp.]MBP6195739.1 sulfate adenylyltransferase subunit CysD [Methyloversatilis sp.]MBP9117258.1 sulfate adenylyltransferase subunit CysD [Methyloversatilis sp.]